MALAGCVDDKEKPQSGGPTAPPAPPAEFGETTGAVEGQVTDDQFNALGGVQVALLNTEHQTLTDPSGKFTFSNLAPGDYALAAVHVGFEPETLTIQVTAGAATPVELQLTPLPTATAYHTTLSQRGLFGCGFSIRPVVGLAACGVLSLILNLTQYDKFLLIWEVAEPIESWEFALFEMDWESTQALGKGLFMVWEVNGCSNDNSFTFAEIEGESPVRANASGNEIRNIIENGDKKADECDAAAEECNLDGCRVQSRVFSSSQTLGEAYPADAGVTFQQSFEQYFTVFYYGPAAPDFTALASEG